MSTTVDQRVVEMRFDNQNFERNVQTSMSTLDKLKAKLHLKGASKGLEEVNSAAKKCNLSPISRAVESVKVKFSAMEVMAVTALSNITNSAVNAGKRMIKALTIDPITTGFNEYETQINAVQTILANTKSKGSTLEDVNNALDELNTYADKTIYNFTEMTRNIGTFTAAGIDLETSVNAIQGIANLAAVSGSTSQQASTAMYQLSQALAAGTVKLTDWNSVVTAGMGGEIFQEALKKTSAELKTGAAAAIEAKGSFRESLQTGWLTAEVLTETLKKFTTSGANEYVAEYTGLSKEAVEAALEDAKAKYGEAEAIEYASKALAEKSGKNADEIKSVLDMAATAQDAATKVKTFSQLWDTLKESAQSGWTQTWEIIIGDFEEAKELLTGLSDFFGAIIQKVSDARNKVLEGALGKTFTDLKEKINSALAPAKKAVDTVNKVKESVSDLGNIVNDVIIGKFGNGQERINKLTKSGQNYYRIQNKVNETLGNAFRYTDEQIEAQDKLLGIQKETTDGTKEETAETVKLTDEKKNLIKKIASMNAAQASAEGYTWEQIAAFQELGKTADKLGMPLDAFIDKMDEIDGRWLLIDSFKSIGKSLVEVFKAIGKAWKNVFPSSIDDKADTLFNIIAAFHKFSRGVLTAATENADKLRRTFEGLFAILDIIRTIAGGVLGLAFRLLNAVLSSMNLNVLDVTASIGDVIVAFRNWLKENNFIVTALETLGSFIGKAIVFIRDFVKMVLGIPAVQNAITKFKNACSNIFSKVGDYFSKGGERIKEFIDRVKDMDSITLADLGKIFEDFRKNVLGYFFNFDGIFEGAKNVLSQFRDKISECFGFIGEKFGWIKDKIAGFVDFIKANIPTIIAMVMGLGLIKALKKIGDALEVFAEPLKSLNDVLNGAANALNSFSGYIKARAWEAKANAIKSLAISLAILTGCIIALTLVNKDRLWDAVLALAALMGIMTAFVLLVTLIGKLGSADPAGVGKSLAILGVSMLSLSISMSILVDILKKMESIDMDKVGTSLAILAGMAVGLVALSIALSRFGGKASISSAVTMIAIVLALKMMVGVLNDLGSLNLGKSLIALGLLFLIINAFKTVLKSCNGVKVGAAVTLIGMVVALKMTIGAIKTLGEMDPQTIIKGLIAIIPIFAMFALVMAASKFAGKNAAKAGVGILAMSVAIVVIIHTIKQLAGMSQSELEKGLATVSILLALFGAIIALSYFAGKNAAKAGAMLLMMSGAILILTGVIWLLQGLSDEGLNRALGAIVVMGAVFAALMVVSKLAGNNKSMIMTLTIAIVALAAVVMALAMLDPAALQRATIALDSIIVVFSALVFALGTIQNDKIGKSIGAVLALTTIVIALAAALAAMTFLPNPETLLPAAESLSLLLLAFSAALIILSKVGDISKNTIGSAYAFAGVVIILSGILSAMTFLPNPQPLILIAVSLSLFLIAFSTALLILSKSDTIAASTMGAAYALSGIVVILAAVLSAMTFLPNPQPLILIATALSLLLLAFSAALLILSNVGQISANTIGSAYALTGVVVILGAVLSAMTFLPNPQPLILIASALSLLLLAFSVALVILSNVGTIAASTIGAAYAMTGVIAILGAVLAAMTFIPNPEALLPIAESLSVLMIALAGVCVVLSLAGVNVGGATNAALGFSAFIGIMAVLLAALGGLAQIPGFTWLVEEGGELLCKIGYILGDFVGSIIGGIGAGITSGLPEMARNISAFGLGIQPFLASMNNVKPEIVENVKNLAAAILVLTAADMLNSISSFFSGGISFVKLAASLSSFGIGIQPFLNSMKAVKPEMVSSVKNLAQAILVLTAADMLDSITSFIFGDNSLEEFANNLEELGDGLSKFSAKVSSIKPDKVKAGSEALKYIAEAAATLPNSGGVVGFFAGENDIQNFTGYLPAVGENLRDFSASLEGIVLDNVKAGADALTYISEAAAKIPNDGGLAGFFAGENAIQNFTGYLPAVGDNLRDFSANLKGIVIDDVKAGADALVYISEAATKIPNSGGIAGFFAGENDIDTFGTKLKTLGSGLASFVSSLKGEEGSFEYGTVNSGVKALNLICESIPSIGDLVQLSIIPDFFGSKLKSIGSGLSGFVSSLKGEEGSFEYGTVNSGVKALDLICGSMPSIGNLVNISVIPDFFGSKLATLGSGINDFSSSLGEFEINKVQNGVSGAKLIAGLSGSIPEESNKFVSFGNNLKKFGGHLSGYFSVMSEISATSIVSAKSAVNAVKDFATNIVPEKVSAAADSMGTLIKTIKGMSGINANSTSGFTSAINNLAKTSVSKLTNSFKMASPEMNRAGKSLISKLIEGANIGASKIGNTSKALIAKFVSSINSQKAKIDLVGKNMIEQVSKGARSQSSKIKNVAIDLMKKFMDGIRSNQAKAKNAFSKVVSECASAAKSGLSTIKSAGKNFVEGFSDGISENTFKAKTQATAMAKSALKAAEEALRINSPSKETYRIGDYFGMGFVDAIDDYYSKVYDSAYDMADYARKGLSGAISRINDVVNSDIDTQPTIRPVIDLTDVRSGANAIGSMLNMRSSVGVIAEANTINSMMNRNRQNGTNDDVIDAIMELRDSLGVSTGDTFNVNGITYDDGSNVSNAVKTLVRAARVGRRR